MSVGSHTLKRRLARLESATDADQDRLEPVATAEDRALIQRIIDRTYADPVGNTDRIAMLDRLLRLEQWRRAARIEVGASRSRCGRRRRGWRAG